jgi:hypothetical protein
LGGNASDGKVKELINEIFETFSDLFGNDSDKDEDEEPDEQVETFNFNEEADREFNTQYGMIDLAMSVAKESGVSYFEMVEHPAAHVLALCTYLQKKVEKIEREQSKKNGNTK